MYAAFNYKVVTIPSVNDVDTLYTFAGFNSRFLFFTVWDQPVIVQLSYNGVTFGDEFEVDPDKPSPEYPFCCKEFYMRNKNAGATARAEVIAMW